MNRKGLILLLVGLFSGMVLGGLVILSSPRTGDPASRKLPPTVGSPVKDFQLDDLSGDSHQLSATQGKAVVLNFWATWCTPCKEEMPLLQAYAGRYSDRLSVIGVNYAETEEKVTPFIQDNAITFPILMDSAGIVTDLYFVRNFPATFFIDKNGVLRAQHIGQLSEELMAKYLKTIGIQP